MTRARQNADNVAGDISGVTAGTGLTGGGTSGTVTLTNDMATTIAAAGDLIYGTGNDTYSALSIGTAGKVLKVNSGATAPEWAVDPTTDVVTTAGDLIYGTGADAVTRLGIGTAGQYLSVNSGATAPEWATPSSGSKTLLSTTTLSSNVTTISSISGAYTDLYVEVYGYTFAASSYVWINLNSATNNTTTVRIQKSASQVSGDTNTQIYAQDGSSLSSDNTGIISLYIYNYADTSKYKSFYQSVGFLDTSSARQQQFRAGTMQTNSALTSIQITSGSTFNSGTVKIWGIK